MAGAENGEFVVGLKNSKEAQKQLLDLRKVQMAMKDSLIGIGKKFNSGNMAKDQAEAMRAVSIAWNLLYMSNVFEDADTTKSLKGEIVAAQAWNMMHPAQKARDKILKQKPEDEGTEETFGGQKGQFLLRQVELSRIKRDSWDFINRYRNNQVYPFPERLLTSYMVHNQVYVDGKAEKIPMAKALLEGKRIDFIKDGRNNDSWSGYYDFASKAKTLYEITTGKIPLVLEVNDSKPAKEMTDWVTALGNARNSLKNNKLISPHINNPHFLLWSIVACVKGDVYPESPHLVMMTPKVYSEAQYDELKSLFNLRKLVENDAERNWVMKMLNCESPGAVKRRLNITGRGNLFTIFS